MDGRLQAALCSANVALLLGCAQPNEPVAPQSTAVPNAPAHRESLLDAGPETQAEPVVDPKQEAQRAFREAWDGCQRDEASACAVVADAYTMGRGVPLSRGCWSRYVRKACELGDIPSCISTAGLLEDEGELAGAATLYARACEGGLWMACESLARAYETGKGVPKSATRATQYYKQACENAKADDQAGKVPSPRACLPYAERLTSGIGVRKDETQAARYFLEACEHGAFEVCPEAAERLADGRGVTKDPARAGELFVIACQNSFGAGCTEGSLTFSDRTRGPQEPTARRRTRRTGCRLGHERLSHAWRTRGLRLRGPVLCETQGEPARHHGRHRAVGHGVLDGGSQGLPGAGAQAA